MNWDELIESETKKDYFKAIKKVILSDSRSGKSIFPYPKNYFRALDFCSFEDLKVVILGQDPYHTSGVADGLAFSSGIYTYMPPSLRNIFLEIEDDVGIKNQNVSLEGWAKQGVLLLNASLTVEKNKAGSHLDIWEPFIQYLFENVLVPLGVPVVFLGKDAGKYQKYMGIFSHSFVVSHPASASYKGIDWDSEGVFSKIDQLLLQNNGFSIEWLKDAEAPF